MTLDLWILTATVLFQWTLIMADATPGIIKNGVPWAAGNRDVTPDPEGMHGRVHRCNLNMQENLPIFVALVLVAHVSGQADATSALGAEIFLGHAWCTPGSTLPGSPGCERSSGASRLWAWGSSSPRCSKAGLGRCCD